MLTEYVCTALAPLTLFCHMKSNEQHNILYFLKVELEISPESFIHGIILNKLGVQIASYVSDKIMIKSLA